MNPSLPAGKIRALDTLSDANGLFRILAIDHRDSLRVLMDRDHPEKVPAERITDLKLAIVREIAPLATAVMLDPVYSIGQAIASGALPGTVGYLSALEEQGYLGDPHARHTSLLTGWSVEKAKRAGAGGIKFLIFYHPDASTAALQEEAVRAVVADCARHEIPVFLEPMAYSLDSSVPLDSEEFARRRPAIVIETARRLSALGPDVLKIQFPIDARHQSDTRAWEEACARLDEASSVPWALLSLGEPYESFKKQLEVACRHGCSGFMAGRALWREVVSTAPAERPRILRDIVAPRFRELSEIARATGKSWKSRYKLPQIDDSWFRGY